MTVLYIVTGSTSSSLLFEECVAVDTLHSWFDRPQLVHQAHVQMIVDAPSLKEGTGCEIWKLHDTVQQHLRALRSMDYKPSGAFLTSFLQLKLDSTTGKMQVKVTVMSHTIRTYWIFLTCRRKHQRPSLVIHSSVLWNRSTGRHCLSIPFTSLMLVTHVLLARLGNTLSICAQCSNLCLTIRWCLFWKLVTAV